MFYTMKMVILGIIYSWVYHISQGKTCDKFPLISARCFIIHHFKPQWRSFSPWKSSEKNTLLKHPSSPNHMMILSSPPCRVQGTKVKHANFAHRPKVEFLATVVNPVSFWFLKKRSWWLWKSMEIASYC